MFLSWMRVNFEPYNLFLEALRYTQMCATMMSDDSAHVNTRINNEKWSVFITLKRRETRFMVLMRDNTKMDHLGYIQDKHNYLVRVISATELPIDAESIHPYESGKVCHLVKTHGMTIPQ